MIPIFRYEGMFIKQSPIFKCNTPKTKMHITFRYSCKYERLYDWVKVQPQLTFLKI